MCKTDVELSKEVVFQVNKVLNHSTEWGYIQGKQMQHKYNLHSLDKVELTLIA